MSKVRYFSNKFSKIGNAGLSAS